MAKLLPCESAMSSGSSQWTSLAPTAPPATWQAGEGLTGKSESVWLEGITIVARVGLCGDLFMHNVVKLYVSSLCR
jgi:hypothetical protein